MGIYSKNRLEWIIADFGCVLSGNTSISISNTSALKELLYIIQHSECNIIICSMNELKNIDKLIKECPLIEIIILMDSEENINTEIIQNKNIQVISFQKLISIGKLNQIELNPPCNNHISSIIYSSGSTGMPKGIYNTSERWNLFLTHIYMISTPLIRLSFLPFSHTTEKQLLYLTLCYGGIMVLSNGNMENIFEEHQLVNPTMIIAPPKFYDQIYNNYQTLLTSLCNNDNIPIEDAQTICKQNLKYILGNRMKIMLVGGASSSENVRQFISDCFGIHLYNAYGSTEAGAITLDGNILYNNKIKIVECEELDLEDDKELGIQRGELWIKSNVSISEYYKNEEATKENISDGWFKTGDVVEYQNGKIQVIDRRKNFFKLSKGLYVSPTTIENELIESPFIEHIFIYGDSLRDSLVAIIIPNQFKLKEWAIEQDIVHDIQNLFQDKRCIDLYFKELNRIIQERNFPSHCAPSMITLVDDQWTPENGLMTPSNKIKRNSVEKKYKDVIEEMYNKINVLRNEELKNELENKLKGISKSFDNNDYPLIPDSLTAVQVWSVLKKYGRMNISVNDITNCSSLDNLLKDDEYINETRRKIENDLNIEIFNNNNEENEQSFDPNYMIKNILLTGSTGFLGVHLLHDLIMRTDYKIYCLIRCSSELQGKERLQNVADMYMIKHNFIEEERINVIKGDLRKDMLGLDTKEWDLVSKSIDTIIHCGALVNWISSYDELRLENVLGTVNLIKLASYNKRKGFIYISSASTYYENGILNSLDSMLHENHYSLSKWVAECIVSKYLKDRINGTIIRPGMITSHSKTGASNPNDFISRIVKGIIMLGSYYENKKGLELIPVDFVSNSIIDILHSRKYGMAYNIRNPNLIYTEQLVNMMSTLGYSIKVKDLNEWIQIIEENPKNPIYPLIPFIDMHDMKIEKDDHTILYEYNIDCKLLDRCIEYLKTK